VQKENPCLQAEKAHKMKKEKLIGPTDELNHLNPFVRPVILTSHFPTL